MFKKYWPLLLALLVLPSATYALSVYLPYQGGTGISTASPTDVGKALIVSSTSPLVYKFGTAGGAGVGTLQGFSTSTYTGLLSYSGQTGYNAANAICNANFAGSHLCSPDEILATVYGGTSVPANTAWIASGPPGYTANANDCLGWQSQTATDLGAYWLFATTTGGQGWLINCSNSKKLSCCK